MSLSTASTEQVRRPSRSSSACLRVGVRLLSFALESGRCVVGAFRFCLPAAVYCFLLSARLPLLKSELNRWREKFHFERCG
jgi:hypothetical protein